MAVAAVAAAVASQLQTTKHKIFRVFSHRTQFPRDAAKRDGDDGDDEEEEEEEEFSDAPVEAELP